jgi:Protein of unknown function (DUF1573)
MKKLLILISIIGLIACNSKEQKSMTIEVPLTSDGKVDTSKLPKFSFVQDVYDFGKIKQGEKISYSFKFKNTGSTPLIISSASASCGCTVPSYPEEPIQPGQESKIDVVFDSNGKMGMQTKTITLVSNTIPNTKVLYLRGEIIN